MNYRNRFGEGWGTAAARLLIICLLTTVTTLRQSAIAQSPQSTREIDFSSDVKPIFAKHCYKCHGPNEAEGGLRLSDEKEAKAELDSGERAIVPGDAAASVMLDRVTSEDEDLRMPPEGKGLDSDEVEILRSWIEQGAPWAAHWSFQPIRRPAIPQPRDEQWVRSPIDAFILARLESAKLSPARPAEKLALVRRVYFDLIGLPPTPQQIDDFLDNSSPDALEQLIDQLLASEQYGEKWARHWLDLVRYAETNGYERDGRKDLIWKYRDYVIRAFNEDKPFDRFILEQLAGDELPDATPESITATGFYRLGIWDDEPADRELARYDYLDDIVRTTGEGFLGVTIGCARCHDHKIDPLSQRDYYSMLSFFSDISNHGSGKTNLVPIATATDRAEFEEQVQQKQAREKTLTAEIQTLRQQLVTAAKAADPTLELQAADSADSDAFPDSIKQGQRWEYTERKPADNWFQIAFDDSRWKKGLGGFGTKGTPGAVVRTEWRSGNIWLRRDFRLTAIPGKVILNIHHDEDVEVYLNGKLIASRNGYTVKYEQIDVSMQAADVLQTGRNTVAIHCRQTGGGQYIDAGLILDGEDRVAALMKAKGAQLLGAEAVQTWETKRRQLAESLATNLEFKPEFAMAVAESGSQKTWILQRGLPALKGEEVDPQYIQVLNPPEAKIENREKTSGKRLALAQWLGSPENPLTARVIANRVWQHHFGRGIVRSSSDFGFQGTPPTHPELLDWLAFNLIDNGWSLKKLHKTIMLSNTYQMSSRGNDRALNVDPQNDLFWRFNMRRLTAEEIRDSVLYVSGDLNPQMYGPPIFPKLSQEVLATASRPGAAWGQSSPRDAARRTIYVHVKRSLRPPMLANFDAADTDTGCAVRLTTTVPTQALGMLNSDFMNEQAVKLATRVRQQAGDDISEQITTAIRITTGRMASDDEVQQDLQFLNKLQAVEKLTSDQAFQAYCLLLLNANEFVYLD